MSEQMAYFVQYGLMGLVAILSFALYMIITRMMVKRKTNNAKRYIDKSQFMPADLFMKNWVSSKTMLGKGRAGFKFVDGPGCYVIKIFTNPTEDMDADNFYDMLIGTGERMCETVYHGFTGKGNKKMYDYYCSSKSIYVKFIRGDANKLDELEAKVYGEYESAISKAAKKHFSKGKKSKKKR